VNAVLKWLLVNAYLHFIAKVYTIKQAFVLLFKKREWTHGVKFQTLFARPELLTIEQHSI
jgi:Ni,Fe-hydrogenase I cytochrome b subunit